MSSSVQSGISPEAVSLPRALQLGLAPDLGSEGEASGLACPLAPFRLINGRSERWCRQPARTQLPSPAQARHFDSLASTQAFATSSIDWPSRSTLPLSAFSSSAEI